MLRNYSHLKKVALRSLAVRHSISGMDREAIFFTGQGGEGVKSAGQGGAGAGNILSVSAN